MIRTNSSLLLARIYMRMPNCKCEYFSSSATLHLATMYMTIAFKMMKYL